jgi:glycerol-3-phosphate dehydrogenase
MVALDTQVLIIGGGATGTAVARDLALRGVACVVVERDDINAGASGRNHGLLHSGARYVANDAEAAAQCQTEGSLLKHLAPQCVDDTGGYFVAVAGDDETYVADFPSLCARAGITTGAVDVADARHLEPALSGQTIAVYAVNDASVDPFKLSFEMMADAKSKGARLLRRTAVVDFARTGARLIAARVRNTLTGEETQIHADIIVNAGGAWARDIARLAGAAVPVLYSKGTLIVTHSRVAQRAINRLRKPSNADIIMPGGTVSIVGTTSINIPDLADVRPTVPEVDLIIDETSAMVPALRDMRYVRAYAGVRPLISAGPAGARTPEASACGPKPLADGSGGRDGRAVSRGFALIDHQRDGVQNLITIAGGKLTTCRLMAEKTADLVCERLGVCAKCLTRTVRLTPTIACAWTEPGLTPRNWMRAHAAEDSLLCECEMVPKSVVDSIVREIRLEPRGMVLADLALRSRLGKGACQGAFCAVRAIAHLYDRGEICADAGLRECIQFFRERWRGQQAVLWGEQLAQAELAEAIHCGLFGEEHVAHTAVGNCAPSPPDP